jgi:hypothetical protein
MRYRMTDDSVTKRGRGSPKYAGKSVTRRGEDLAKSHMESGRTDARARRETTGAGRPAHTSSARDITSVNPQDPIDPAMPNLR